MLRSAGVFFARLDVHIVYLDELARPISRAREPVDADENLLTINVRLGTHPCPHFSGGSIRQGCLEYFVLVIEIEVREIIGDGNGNVVETLVLDSPVYSLAIYLRNSFFCGLFEK